MPGLVTTDYKSLAVQLGCGDILIGIDPANHRLHFYLCAKNEAGQPIAETVEEIMARPPFVSLIFEKLSSVGSLITHLETLIDKW